MNVSEIGIRLCPAAASARAPSSDGVTPPAELASAASTVIEHPLGIGER